MSQSFEKEELLTFPCVDLAWALIIGFKESNGIQCLTETQLNTLIGLIQAEILSRGQK